MKMFLLSAIVLFVLGVKVNGIQPPIAYKYVNQYKYIWNDRGSGAKEDVSIWRPLDFQAGFYPLGDIAVESHGKPNNFGLTVRALTSDALAPPASFTEIWRDRGSGANQDVKILRLNPRHGYTCLGYVAVNGYGSSPNLYLYRCVKSVYLTQGSYEPIWRDHGSGARADVGLWSNSEIGNHKAVFANTFTAIASHSKPSGKPYLLHSDHAKLHSLVSLGNNIGQQAIRLYEMTVAPDLIWNDGGSGGRYDFSVFRSKSPSGFYSLGDIPIGSYSTPRVSLIAKNLKQDALKAPISFSQRWNDRGSGARWDVAFYEPRCPAGYVALGHVAVRNHHTPPSTNDVRCVKYEYTVPGRWEWVWNDRSTGSRHDVTVWRSVPSSNAGQGVRAMGTVRRHGGMDRTAYVLKKSVVDYVAGKPARRYFLTNIRYLFDDRKTLGSTPEQLARTIIINRGNTPQLVVRTISYTYSETHDWSLALGLEIGVQTTVTAGVPAVASTSTTVSVKTSMTTTWGESVTTSKTDSIQTRTTVQPKSQKTVTVVTNRYIADVPYIATLTAEYTDGTRQTSYNYKGVYRGAQIAEVTVVKDPDVPIGD